MGFGGAGTAHGGCGRGVFAVICSRSTGSTTAPGGRSGNSGIFGIGMMLCDDMGELGIGGMGGNGGASCDAARGGASCDAASGCGGGIFQGGSCIFRGCGGWMWLWRVSGAPENTATA